MPRHITIGHIAYVTPACSALRQCSSAMPFIISFPACSSFCEMPSSSSEEHGHYWCQVATARLFARAQPTRYTIRSAVSLAGTAHVFGFHIVRYAAPLQATPAVYASLPLLSNATWFIVDWLRLFPLILCHTLYLQYWAVILSIVRHVHMREKVIGFFFLAYIV